MIVGTALLGKDARKAASMRGQPPSVLLKIGLRGRSYTVGVLAKENLVQVSSRIILLGKRFFKAGGRMFPLLALLHVGRQTARSSS